MQWALIATTEQQLMVYTPELNWHFITVQPGTIINTIVYDGVTEYTPPEGSRLLEVSVDAKIGDTGYNE
jgi:hypothetical protein